MSESLGSPNNEWCGWSVDYAGAAEFTQFLQKKGAPESNVLIWADYKDWLVLPADLRKEIMSWDIVFDIDVTRSFPHDWTFKGPFKNYVILFWTPLTFTAPPCNPM